MAKSFYEYVDYQEVSGNVPWKWMAMEFLIDKLAMTKTNDEFFDSMNT